MMTQLRATQHATPKQLRTNLNQRCGLFPILSFRVTAWVLAPVRKNTPSLTVNAAFAGNHRLGDDYGRDLVF